MSLTKTESFTVIRTIEGLRQKVANWRYNGMKVGVVPTMGALHEGHLSLLDKAREQCDRTIVTLFVNPLQFGPTEDYESYPRNEKSDIKKLRERGCDVLFAPSVKEMFPDGRTTVEQFTTIIHVRGLSDVLCGVYRPKHFQGMATEVCKLLLITLGDVAYFGEKDYQQLQIIKTMVRDLNIPVRIEGVPTVRDKDGLALSSRNAYLSEEERRIAPKLHHTLCHTAQKVVKPGVNVKEELQKAITLLLRVGFNKVDYFSLVDAETLTPIDRVEKPARLLAAAWLGKARLIDNVPVGVDNK